MKLLAVLFAGLAFVAAPAFAVTPAYEGCTIAWDYPEGVADHKGFVLSIDGVGAPIELPKEQRTIPCADSQLGDAAFGAYTVSLVASAEGISLDSLPATLDIEYLPRPRLDMPSSITITLEWKLTND
jgi:hypothetical protein